MPRQLSYKATLGGHSPLICYEDTAEAPRNYESKSIIVIPDKPFISGICFGYVEVNEWPMFINKKEGWVCYGDPKIEGKRLVQYAPQCVASLVGEDLVALWLHPESLPKNLPPGQPMPDVQRPETN